MLLFIRWILELLVMISLVAGALKLHDDWDQITPPVWRWIILGYQGVLVANGAALLFAITKSLPITAYTWGIITSYFLLLLPLLFEKYMPMPPRNRRASDRPTLT